MTGVERVRELALVLPRSYEVVVRGRLKFRVGRLVFLAFSPDEQIMGFAYPKEERDGLISSDRAKFHMPRLADQRYNWVEVRLARIDDAEMRELVLEAWSMVVPKGVAESYFNRGGEE